MENKRVSDGRVVQRQVLYLGELNDVQRAGWVRTIEGLEPHKNNAHQLALFPDDQDELPELSCEVVQVRLNEIKLRRPRQWGACWLALRLWNLLDLDGFWASLLIEQSHVNGWELSGFFSDRLKVLVFSHRFS